MARKIKRAYARYSESFKAEAVRGIYKLCNHCRCGAFPLTLMVTGHVLHNLSNLLNMTILGLLADINQLYFNKNKHKKRAFRRKPFFIFWCERRDSNSHALRRWYLKPVRLPIPPLSHFNWLIICQFSKSSIVTKNRID